MSRFIAKLSFIIVPLILIGLGMEFFLRQIPNDYLLKKEYLEDHGSEIEALILGSSHSFYGIDPEYFSLNTFNASYISQSLGYDFGILKKFQDSLVNLKTIVLPISYFTLYQDFKKSEESWRAKNYVIYYKINSSHALKDHSEVLSNQFKLNFRRLQLYYFTGISNISCTDLGWGTAYKSKDATDLYETGLDAASRHLHIDNSAESDAVFHENRKLLNLIVKWAELRDIRVLLLTLPAYKTYYENLNSDQLSGTINTSGEIASQHENCLYTNLLKDTTYIESDYFDGDHLSEIGAQKLSKQISELISNWP